MIFESLHSKYHAMKKISISLFVVLALTLIWGSETQGADRGRKSKDDKLARVAEVRKSIESGRFIIRLNRIYFTRGGIADLRPRSNYIIFDRGKALISTAYLGRQYEIRPITGINMTGKATISELNSSSSKGKYRIKMKVDNGTQTLDVTLRIESNGTCNATISGLMIDNTTYSGQLVPVQDKTEVPPPPGIQI
jgi:hypothetical protein